VIDLKKIFLLLICVAYGILFYIGLNDRDTTVVSERDPLFVQINAFANANNVDPVEPRFCPIWQRIPGLNGLRVNVQASFDQMRSDNHFNENLIVWEEIPVTGALNELRMGPVFHGNRGKAMVSFVINVAWGEEYVPEMLEILERHDVAANFFIEGNFANKHPELIMDMYTQGHLIGNHSMSHANFRTITRDEQRTEIVSANNILSNLTLQTVRFFGPPSGAFNEETVALMDEANMQMVMWDVDTIDWQNPSVSMILSRVMNKVDKGSIILMHPTANTVEALETMILEIHRMGLEINDLNALFSPRR